MERCHLYPCMRCHHLCRRGNASMFMSSVYCLTTSLHLFLLCQASCFRDLADVFCVYASCEALQLFGEHLRHLVLHFLMLHSLRELWVTGSE